MITGVVNANRAATIILSVRDSQGLEQQFEAIVDTGFNGSLTLPLATIIQLGLVWSSRGQAVLANGSLEEFDIYAATVIWDSQPRSVLVEAVETDPLVGMSRLYGHDLHIQVLDGGANALVHHGQPFYIDWQVAHYGPFYLDLPHHFCTLEQAEHYRAALAALGREIPAPGFADHYRAAARCIGFRYLWWTLDGWRGTPGDTAWVRHYLSLILG